VKVGHGIQSVSICLVMIIFLNNCFCQVDEFVVDGNFNDLCVASGYYY